MAKWNELSIREKAAYIKAGVNNGLRSIEDIEGAYNKFDEGGYTSAQEDRERINQAFDPTGGLRPYNYFLSGAFGNLAKGEENEYWRAYLGLSNAVPRMKVTSKTEWDDKIEAKKKEDGEPLSDFYGTTPRMDYAILALADTTNLGKVYRETGKHKFAYNQAKTLLENPGKWTQIYGDEDIVTPNTDFDKVSETNPLGMLAHFGAKWVPEEGKIYVHDTYDFPSVVTTLTTIPKRPKEMKIRGAIGFNPKKGSKYFNGEEMPEALVHSTGGPLYPFSFNKNIPIVRY